MKGFSMPHISIPNISIPKISSIKDKVDVNSIKDKINVSSIRNSITSSIPDLDGITKQINLEQIGSDMLKEAINEGIELPSEIRDMIK